LDPERMKSYEAGYQGRFFDRVKARVDFFYSEYANLIDAGPVILPSGPPAQRVFRQQVVNVGAGDTIGVEPEAEVFFTSWLTGFVNYTFQHQTGKLVALGGVPEHKGNAGLILSPGYGLFVTAFTHISGPLN